MNGLLLDTCAVIWSANGDPLADDAVEAITSTFQQNRPVQISPISAWEVGLLAARQRITISGRPEAWFSQILKTPGVALSGFEPEMLIASSFLPGAPPRDPADRIIIATAREYDLTIVTRDGKILEYAEEGHVSALAC